MASWGLGGLTYQWISKPNPENIARLAARSGLGTMSSHGTDYPGFRAGAVGKEEDIQVDIIRPAEALKRLDYY